MLAQPSRPVADLQRSGSLPRHAAPAPPSANDGGHGARPPAPLLGGKARASEKRFREQEEEEVPSSGEEASSSASPPAPLIGTAARASAARFAAQTASAPPGAAAKPAAVPPLAAAPAPAAARSAPRPLQPAAQPATPAPSANPTTPPNNRANPLPQEQPASQQSTVATKQTPPMAAKATAAAGSMSADAKPQPPSVASAPLPAMLSRLITRARQSLQPQMAARGIKPVPLAAVLSAAATRPASAGNGASADTEGLGSIPLAPALATAAMTLLAALGVGAALLRCHATPSFSVLPIRLHHDTYASFDAPLHPRTRASRFDSQCPIHTYICQCADLVRRSALKCQALHVANSKPLQCRRAAGANGKPSDEAVEEVEELQEEIDEQHDTSSMVTSMVSPAPSVSRLSRCGLDLSADAELAAMPCCALTMRLQSVAELAMSHCLDTTSHAGRPVAAG